MTMTLTTAADGAVRPLPHDFPYRTCWVCGFPIAPGDLADDDYLPHHRSTCRDAGRTRTAQRAKAGKEVADHG